MKQTDKATARPWKFIDENKHQIRGPKGIHIATCHYGDNSPDHVGRNANAALIVRAVNSHDALVEALKNAHTSLRTFRNVPKDEQDWTSYDDDVMKNIEKALALAEGGAK